MENLDTPEEERDGHLMIAAFNEVRRRYVAAGWFWRRWFKPHEYRKWVDHTEATNRKAQQELIDVYEKYDDPKSREVVRRLKERMRNSDESEARSTDV